MKPKHLVICTAALLLSSAHFSAFAWWGNDDIKGNGNVTEQSQSLGKVDEISLALPAQVKVVAGEGKLSIKAEENLLPYITVTEKGDELEIGTKNGYSLNPKKPIEISISVEALSSLSLAGSGDVVVGAFSGEELDLDLAGAASLVMDKADYRSIDIDIAGSGDVVIKDGQSDELSVDIAGSGDVDTSKVQAAKADIDIAGSGDVSLRAKDSLDISVAGSGDVVYFGNPSIKQSVMGSGNVTRKGD